MSSYQKEFEKMQEAMNEFLKVNRTAIHSSEIIESLTEFVNKPFHEMAGMLLNPFKEEITVAMAPFKSALAPIMTDFYDMIFAIFRPVIQVLFQIVAGAGPLIEAGAKLLGFVETNIIPTGGVPTIVPELSGPPPGTPNPSEAIT